MSAGIWKNATKTTSSGSLVTGSGVARLRFDGKTGLPAGFTAPSRMPIPVTSDPLVNLPYGYDIRCEVVCELGTVALGDGSPVVVRKDGFRSDHVPGSFRSGSSARWIPSFRNGSIASTRANPPTKARGMVMPPTAVGDACVARWTSVNGSPSKPKPRWDLHGWMAEGWPQQQK